MVIRDGGVVLQNLSSAEVSPNETTEAIDRAQMLAATAAAASISNAIAVARATIGDDPLLGFDAAVDEFPRRPGHSSSLR